MTVLGREGGSPGNQGLLGIVWDLAVPKARGYGHSLASGQASWAGSLRLSKLETNTHNTFWPVALCFFSLTSGFSLVFLFLFFFLYINMFK